LRPGRPQVTLRTSVVIAIAVLGVLGTAANGYADAPVGPPSATPASGTPHLVSTGTTEQIRQLVQCGTTMYAVGTFTEIQSGKTVFTRNGAFSFAAEAPFAVTSWDPEVNGTVNSIAFNGSNCSDAYIGGKFTEIGSTAAKDIAEVDTTTGAVVPTFKASASAEVDTIVGFNGHLLTGGTFKSINGSAADPYFTSLNPTTGRNDGYLALSISGNYNYQDDSGRQVSSNPTRVYNQQISPDGTRDLIEGDFMTVGGQPRQQVAVIDLGATAASIDAWYAPEFNAYCATSEPFYARGGAWSPDGQTIYIATTGYKPANGYGYYTSQPRAGLCDASSAFPSTAGQVSHLWINYTGCDSEYAAAADSSTAYFAGHERWADNPDGCDNAGPGAVSTGGLVGLSPTTGAVSYNPTRARGLGADDMLITSDGLWVASDNLDGSAMCGGVSNHSGICLLPYTS
jgi:hypothetical protein